MSSQPTHPPDQPYASVWFDCDSTLSAIEGVDELMGQITPEERDAIKALTDQAMNGRIPLEQVYGERLGRMAPTAADLGRVAREYVQHTTPGTLETVATLKALGKRVGVISGGLQQPVESFAVHCGFDPKDVHAVPVLLDPQGCYRDFDRGNGMWRSGGKREFFRALGEEARPAAHIGDGATDLEAVGILELFLGFGGVVARPLVRDGCDRFLSENDLRHALPHLLTESEWERAATDLNVPSSVLSFRPNP